MKIKVKIGDLCNCISDFKNKDLVNNRELLTSDLSIGIETPQGTRNINAVIKKSNLLGLRIKFENGQTLTCANKHILFSNGTEVYADQLLSGMKIDTKIGSLQIDAVEQIPSQDFYDISVPYPFQYYDANGILHHNTLVTAVLSMLCEEFGRTVVIVPSKSLVVQTEEDYKNLGLDVGVFFGDRKEIDKTHTICTWQSLNALQKKSKDKLTSQEEDTFLSNIVAVIVDEAHSSKADVLHSLLTGSFGSCPIRWGLTGTVPKKDYEFYSLLTAIGPVTNKVMAHELQEKGVLSDVFINIIQTMETMEFKDYHSEYQYLTTDKTRLAFLAELIKEASNFGNTLVLIDRIETGEKLTNFIPDSVFIHGNVKNKQRKEHYDEVNVGENKILIATYGTSSTGINIPRIFNLFLLEPGKSFIRTIQSIGRGIRKAKDKDYVNVFDVCSYMKYSKKHLRERKKYYNEAKYPYKITKVKI